jgi:tetratricopeptide (TPR) repeat protein
MRLSFSILTLLVLSTVAAIPARLSAQAPASADLVAAGDAAWARRAEGHQGGRAAPGPIGEAITLYERAAKEQPARLEASWKLLRALFFKGEHAAQSNEEKQKVFGHGKEVAEAAVDRLAQKVGGRAKLDAMAPAQAAKALSGAPEAAPVILWAGVHWGLWGDAFGRMAAARQGVGDKVRRYGETGIALDETYDEAAGHRLLGRLHDLAPKIPFVTGWVDHDKAVTELRRAVALAPENFLNQLYLAEAILDHQPAKAAEAKEILRKLTARTPRPAWLVEDEKALAEARARLAKP